MPSGEDRHVELTPRTTNSISAALDAAMALRDGLSAVNFKHMDAGNGKIS